MRARWGQPSATGFYAAINGCIFVCLAMTVVWTRMNRKQSIIGTWAVHMTRWLLVLSVPLHQASSIW